MTVTDTIVNWTAEDEGRAAQEGWYLWRGAMQSTMGLQPQRQALNSADEEDHIVLYAALERRVVSSDDPWYKHALEYIDWWRMVRVMTRSGDWP